MTTKVRFVRTILVELEKANGEFWDKQFNRWDELMVESYQLSGNFAYLTTFDGDVYVHVPRDAFEFVKGGPFS